MKRPQDHVMVIFGASGDLTRRKLIPALFLLDQQGLLPARFAILGAGRTKFDDTGYREKIKEEIQPGNESRNSEWQGFLNKLNYVSLNTESVDEYRILKSKLEVLFEQLEIQENIIFYLATPPSLYQIIANGLASSSLNTAKENCWRRIIIEKPFGYDLASARELNRRLQSCFYENQIFRIDHYLGKETVQNIMVTRFSNGIFEPLWNRNYVHHIEITSSESQGVEGRGEYYDVTGALRDMVQNHLMQLAAIIAMEPPAVNNPDAIRNETLKVFQALKPLNSRDIKQNVIRGQYTKSIVRNQNVLGYRDEDHISRDSRTETFVAIKLYIENWRWGGVPFYIRTGKRLPTNVTEAVIHFKPTPHKLFCFNDQEWNHDNQLVIRIQPDEGILLKFGMKIPGVGYRVQQVNMDFHYSDLGEMTILDAYQRLLLDCMNNDSTLYTRGDAVEEAWKFVDPILKYWKDHPENPLHGYPSGTWGPKAADNLIEGENLTWRYPCKNLTNNGIYCEL
jgi:glucose-6-phosphate 1-dehydrogenase